MTLQKMRGFDLETWKGYVFETSSGKTPEWTTFSRQLRMYLKRTLTPEFEVVNYMRGHFYFSAFVRHLGTGQLLYLSCSDVRFFRDGWYNNVLVRTAENERDFTGGRNTYTNLANLKSHLEVILGSGTNG